MKTPNAMMSLLLLSAVNAMFLTNPIVRKAAATVSTKR